VSLVNLGLYGEIKIATLFKTLIIPLNFVLSWSRQVLDAYKKTVMLDIFLKIIFLKNGLKGLKDLKGIKGIKGLKGLVSRVWSQESQGS